MTDIVERLRGLHVKRHPSRSVVECDETTILEAADRIEKLEAALREFCDRVDRGEVKSVKTYAKFKALLEERT